MVRARAMRAVPTWSPTMHLNPAPWTLLTPSLRGVEVARLSISMGTHSQTALCSLTVAVTRGQLCSAAVPDRCSDPGRVPAARIALTLRTPAE